jgi:hypothetical protein
MSERVIYQWDSANDAVHNQIVEIFEIAKREGVSDQEASDRVQRFLEGMHEEFPSIVSVKRREVVRH